MAEENKLNLQYFAASSMRHLYIDMQAWQQLNHKRFLSVSIHEDRGEFCCIALTNPSEVVITSSDGKRHAKVDDYGNLCVYT